MFTLTAYTVALILNFVGHHPAVGMQIDATGESAFCWQIVENIANHNGKGIQLAGANVGSTDIVVFAGDDTSTAYSYLQYKHDGSTIVSYVRSAQFPSVKGANVPISGSLTTTSGTSYNVTVTGMTASGHCSLTTTNASAVTNSATTYISAKTTNQITVIHMATVNMNYNILCTPK